MFTTRVGMSPLPSGVNTALAIRMSLRCFPSTNHGPSFECNCAMISTSQAAGIVMVLSRIKLPTLTIKPAERIHEAEGKL